jgi:hypothetical protein
LLEEGQAIQLVIALRCTDVSVELKRRSAEDPPYVAVQRDTGSAWPLVIVGQTTAYVRALGEDLFRQEWPHFRYVKLRLVLVGVVPRAVQVEERSQVLLGRGPREVVAASLVDEGGRVGSGEGR